MARVLRLMSFAISVALIGCAHSGQNMQRPTPHDESNADAETEVAVSMNISARLGGRLALPNGIVVVFDPGSLESDRLVSIRAIAPDARRFPSNAYRPLAQALGIDFAPVDPARPVALPPRRKMDAFEQAPKIWISVTNDAVAASDRDAETLVRLTSPGSFGIDAFPRVSSDALIASFNPRAVDKRSKVCATIWIRRNEARGFGFTFLRRA